MLFTVLPGASSRSAAAARRRRVRPHRRVDLALFAALGLVAACGQPGPTGGPPSSSAPPSASASAGPSPGSGTSPSPSAGSPVPSPDVVVRFGEPIERFVPNDVAFLADGRPIVVGEAFGPGDGVVGRSDDEGRTWRLGRTELSSILSVATASEAVWIVAFEPTDPSGRHNPLFRSTDGGTGWTFLGGIALRDPVFADPATGWAIPVGLPESVGPVILATRDGGVGWTPLPAPCTDETPYLTGLAASADHRVWVACSGEAATGMSAKAIYVAREGVGPWELRSSALPPDRRSVGQGLWASGHVTGLAASGVTLVSRSPSLRSDDGGRSWLPLRLGEPDVAEPQAIALRDPSALAALLMDPNAQAMKLMWSSDGGATWEERHAWERPG